MFRGPNDAQRFMRTLTKLQTSANTKPKNSPPEKVFETPQGTRIESRDEINGHSPSEFIRQLPTEQARQLNSDFSRSGIYENIRLQTPTPLKNPNERQSNRMPPQILDLSQRKASNYSRDGSLFGDISSDKSTRLTGTTSKSIPTPSLTEQQAVNLLFDSYEVFINRVRTKLRTEFLPTSNGMRFLLLTGDTYVNLSWLHSIKQLENNKMLLLYYDLQDILENKKPSIESLVIEFVREGQLSYFLAAVKALHELYHDEDVEKLYHQMC